MSKRRSKSKRKNRAPKPAPPPPTSPSKAPVKGIVAALVVCGALLLVAYRAGWFSGPDVPTERSSAAASPGPSESSSREQPDIDKSAVVQQVTTVKFDTTTKIPDEPANDGWPTEAFHLESQAVLDKVGALIEHPADIDADACRPFVVPQFHCGPLVPESLLSVYEDNSIRVERHEPSSEAPAIASEPGNDYRGADGLAAALQQLKEPLQDEGEIHVKFKMIRVDLRSDRATTKQLVSVSGPTEAGLLEQHSTWVTTWALRPGGHPPQLSSIRVEAFRQVRTEGSHDTLFSDCTESVLGGEPCYAAQILRGYDDWLQRTQENRYFFYFGNPGIALGDVNQDGRDDLYVCQEDGLPNLLLITQPDGTVRNAADLWEVDWLHNSRSALLVDFDNDGDQDLAVAVTGAVILASNEGGKQFSIRDVLPTADDVMSLCAADYDRDGRLDLYSCAYDPTDELANPTTGVIGIDRVSFVYHDANNGGPNHLFRNESDWQFRDVTVEAGLDENNRRWSFAAAWEDYDNDGDQDLYVANDFGRDNLYRNDGGKFEDVAEIAGAEDSGSGMGVTWGDFNRDGWMDVHVSNMFSAAGNRVTFQDQFMRSVDPEVKRRHQRLGRGNTLLKNRGDGGFDDVSAAADVEMGRWAWGSNFIDLNNDGWEDLLVANGHITSDDTGDL